MDLIYLRLIGYTAGTLIQLFWMVVILGYRRQRNFERIFFFLCLSLFFFYGGSLLALNAQIYYSQPPPFLNNFAACVILVGLAFFPALLLHLHLNFAATRGIATRRGWNWAQFAFAYLPLPFFVAAALQSFLAGEPFSFVLPLNRFGLTFVAWAAALFLISALWQRRFSLATQILPEKGFHRFLGLLLSLGGISLLLVHFALASHPAAQTLLANILALLPIPALTVLIYYVQRHNFLQIGRQKNLLYAVSATFLALLYLSLVRRVGVWLEPLLPPEASAAILLFILVIFIEPLQRTLGRMLRETAQREFELVKSVERDILEEAKQGDLPRLIRFTEQRIASALQLADAKLILGDRALTAAPISTNPFAVVAQTDFPILQDQKQIGLLFAQPHGSAISGETVAALEYLCEQLPGALDLCRLIATKLTLERELAERERLAVLGQMAASISHNLKNPLGSIKTILQLQLENPQLPESIRPETKMILDEVARLSGKLNQLLQFSRPTFSGGAIVANADLARVIEEVSSVLRHDAENRGVKLAAQPPKENTLLAITPEALHDILTNLVTNAIEATPAGGHVTITIELLDHECRISIEDDGVGISAETRDKISQPFFTTKARGTGLGLAIVTRRLSDFAGTLQWDSPLLENRGTRFVVTLPIAPPAAALQSGREARVNAVSLYSASTNSKLFSGKDQK